MSYMAKRALLLALIILAVAAGLCAYNGLTTGAKLLGFAAAVPLCILAGVGWSYVWDAVSEGKMP